MAGTVLVTGAGGFAGGHLVELLRQRGPVTAWTRRTVDLLDRTAVFEGITALQPAQVYHCAGSPHVASSWKDAATPLATNIIGTDHLLEALYAAGCRARVLIPGSATVYAPSDRPIREDDALRPASPYALSKLGQELLALRGAIEDGVDVVLTRSFNHIGPGQSAEFAISSFARQIAVIERGGSDPVLRVGNLDAERDFTDVRDVARAYVDLMDRGAPETIYNVSSGVGRSIRSMLDALRARARVDVRVELDPERLRPHDVPRLVGDHSRLREATGWEPRIPIEQTLDDLLEYWRQRV